MSPAGRRHQGEQFDNKLATARPVPPQWDQNPSTRDNAATSSQFWSGKVDPHRRAATRKQGIQIRILDPQLIITPRL
jgi:hypothetical protein